MKFSEKMLLIKQGATLADIKNLEEEEAAEIAEAKNHEGDNNQQDDANNPQSDGNNSQEVDNTKELLSALEAANLALEQSKATIEQQKKDYEKLNDEFLKLTNSQTVNDNVTKTGADVFAELFTNQTKED